MVFVGEITAIEATWFAIRTVDAPIEVEEVVLNELIIGLRVRIVGEVRRNGTIVATEVMPLSDGPVRDDRPESDVPPTAMPVQVEATMTPMRHATPTQLLPTATASATQLPSATPQPTATLRATDEPPRDHTATATHEPTVTRGDDPEPTHEPTATRGDGHPSATPEPTRPGDGRTTPTHEPTFTHQPTPTPTRGDGGGGDG